MSQVLEDPVSLARQALERHSWNEAFELLQKADSEVVLSADDLVALSEAAWWTAHVEESIDARQRAYNAFVGQDNNEMAAMTALVLAREFGMKGDGALAGGWFGRAERILSSLPDCVAHGYLAMTKAQAVPSTEQQAFAALSQEALDSGVRFGDKSLQAYGLAMLGMAKVGLGEIEAGLALLDEATIAAVSGDLDIFATGIIYCMTISTCRDLADYRRAGEWTDAAKRWCERQSINGFPGVCRVHRAEIMSLRGDWAIAEQEARHAADEIMRYNLSPIAAFGFYEIGQIRMRMGDFHAAEEAFMQTHQMGQDPQPGLSLLRLYQGKPEQAAASIRRAVEENTSHLDQLRLFPAQVEIALANGDLETAKTAAGRLSELAATVGSPAIHAASHYSNAMVALHEGRHSDAARVAKQGWKHWMDVDVPYEAARTRALLARIYRASGDEEEAKLEMSSARSAFEKLGAVPDLRAAVEFLGGYDEGVKAAGERTTKTFMFTDIVQSTALVEAMGDEAWESLISWHDRSLRALLAQFAGEEIRHQGDGFAFAFESPAAAINCAVAIQRHLADHRKKTGFAPQVRIGVHSAETIKRGLDYAGRGIHEAARIAALAEGGEILTSVATATEARSACSMSEPRKVELKGLAEAVEVTSLDWR